MNNCDCGCEEDYDEYGDSELGQWFKKINEEMKTAFASGDLDIMADVYKRMAAESPYDEDVTEILLFDAIEGVMLEMAMEIAYRGSS